MVAYFVNIVSRAYLDAHDYHSAIDLAVDVARTFHLSLALEDLAGTWVE